MSVPPAQPKIFHITHIENLPSILACGSILSDAEKMARNLANTNIGITDIKQRRLTELHVACHPGTKVGGFVPFYFCPRSIMLYLLHMGNHPALTYSGGQQPILHLQADLHSVIRWADENRRLWAFTTSNAGARYADFYNTPADLDKIEWTAVQANDFRDSMVKEHKQAEFLLHGAFPWHLVEGIGTYDARRLSEVAGLIANMQPCPKIAIQRAWYY